MTLLLQLLSLALISRAAVGPAYADRHTASLKPHSSLSDCLTCVTDETFLLQLLISTARQAASQTSAEWVKINGIWRTGCSVGRRAFNKSFLCLCQHTWDHWELTLNCCLDLNRHFSTNLLLLTIHLTDAKKQTNHLLSSCKNRQMKKYLHILFHNIQLLFSSYCSL